MPETLDLIKHEALYPHYVQLDPRGGKRFSGRLARRALYQSLWSRTEQVVPGAFQYACEHIVPTVTNGRRDDPTRQQLLDALWSVVNLNVDPTNPLEVNLAAMVATRSQRWQALCQRLNTVVPDRVRLYRYVRDGARANEKFVADVAEQWRNGTAQTEIQLKHDRVTAWSMLESGAMTLRGMNTGPGVLYVAEVPLAITLADILVDNSAFIKPFFKQAEVLVRTDVEDVLRADAAATRIFFRNRTYGVGDRYDLLRDLAAARYP